MDISKYLESMKNLPDRFSNLAFWRGVRKLKDEMVKTFEYVGEWGNGIENGLSGLGDDLRNTKSQLSESINGLEGDLDFLNGYPLKYSITWVDDGYIDQTNGDIISYDGWSYTDYIELKKNSALYVTTNSNIDNVFNAFYDSNKSFITNFNIRANSDHALIDSIPQNAKYVRVSRDSKYSIYMYPNTEITDIKSDITTLENTDTSLDSRISALENSGGGGGGALVFNSNHKTFNPESIEVLESNLDTSESGSLLVPYPKVIYARFIGTLSDLEANSLIVNALMTGSVAVSNGQQYSTTVQFHDEPMYAVRVNDTSYKLYTAWIPFAVKTKDGFRVTMPNLTVYYTTAVM